MILVISTCHSVACLGRQVYRAANKRPVSGTSGPDAMADRVTSLHLSRAHETAQGLSYPDVENVNP